MNHSDGFLDRLTSIALDGLVGHIKSAGGQHIQVPSLGKITGACENVDRSFRVKDGRYLIQTGQLFLEAKLRMHPHVYADVWSSRDEPVDERHLDQFKLVEEEFRWTCGPGEATPDGALQSVIDRASDAIRNSLASIIEELGSELKDRRDALKRTLESDWPVISHHEGQELAGIDPASGRVDFLAADEQAIVARRSEPGRPLPVFVTRYPEEIKFFNMRTARPDRAHVLSVDLLLPFSGETLGGAVREDDYDELETRLSSSSMLKIHMKNGGTYNDFAAYLKLVRKGLPPHAGYGLGLERLLQFVLGVPDIRRASAAYPTSVEVDWTSSEPG
jgi:asparaginyl-tRNA synthetase